jgi:hypothetical protein
MRGLNEVIQSSGDAMNTRFFDRHLSKVVQILALMLLMACSNQKPTEIATSGEAEAAKSITEAEYLPCAQVELAALSRPEGVVVDFEKENLPKGLFLASRSELLIEKLGDATTVPPQPGAHVLIREIHGGKDAEIKCADGVERLGTDFDLTLTGPVKFETSTHPWGSGFVLRQFFFFLNRKGYGAVISNPKPGATVVDLRRLLREGVTPGQLFRVNDHAFVIRYVRERESGVRATLSIRLDRI